METKSETIALMPCRCGASRAIVAQVTRGLWVVGCPKCPTHARGSTEADARKNWNAEVSRNGNTRKGN